MDHDDERDHVGHDDGERDRLQFVAEVSESLITTLDAGRSAAQLAELAVSRLRDWAVVSLVGEDGGPAEEAWPHRDPGMLADVDTDMAKHLRNTGDDEAMVEALMSGRPVQMIPGVWACTWSPASARARVDRRPKSQTRVGG